jgi:hypothetical protein
LLGLLKPAIILTRSRPFIGHRLDEFLAKTHPDGAAEPTLAVIVHVEA